MWIRLQAREPQKIIAHRQRAERCGRSVDSFLQKRKVGGTTRAANARIGFGADEEAARRGGRGCRPSTPSLLWPCRPSSFDEPSHHAFPARADTALFHDRSPLDAIAKESHRVMWRQPVLLLRASPIRCSCGRARARTRTSTTTPRQHRARRACVSIVSFSCVRKTWLTVDGSNGFLRSPSFPPPTSRLEERRERRR